ncbi:hypothetical protein B7494_g4649 [Chlorociboria aeruginascens]|nr:hypothetical protein B7494_g4649 [Chlorociboria aeruginascens]
MLFAVSCLSLLTSALPFAPRNREPLVRRATYSVVPVDGGSSATTGDGQSGETTIIETVTDSPITKTIDDSNTVLITITPAQATATVTATGYTIINVSSPTVTVEIPVAQAPPSTIAVSASTTSISESASPSTPTSFSTLSTSSTTSTISESTPYTCSTTASTSTSTPLRPLTTIQISNLTSYSSTISPLTLISSSSVAATIPSIISTTTKSYDDGKWHTTYPAWSNSTASMTGPAPTLPPSSVIDAPSGGVNSEEVGDGLAKRFTAMLNGGDFRSRGFCPDFIEYVPPYPYGKHMFLYPRRGRCGVYCLPSRAFAESTQRSLEIYKSRPRLPSLDQHLGSLTLTPNLSIIFIPYTSINLNSKSRSKMGTNGLIGLITRGARHAAFNMYDSYPTGLGQDIVAFLLALKPEEYSEMDRLISAITWVDRKSTPPVELQERYEKAGFSDLQVSRQRLDDWYCLLRNIQGEKLLPAIKAGLVGHLCEEIEFLKDGLFCEWAYFIDFENQKLEVWNAAKMFDEITFEKLGDLGIAYMQGLETRLCNLLYSCNTLLVSLHLQFGMGGKAFSSRSPPLNTPRMPLKIYNLILASTLAILHQHYCQVASAIEAPGKQTYGDVDVLVAAPLDKSLDYASTPTNEVAATLAKALGAKEWIKEKGSPTINLAIPWPPSYSTEAQKDEENEDKFVQVDIHVCASEAVFNWEIFHSAHGDLWNILGTMIRRFGLTPNDRGLYIRIPEIELNDRKKSMVFLTAEASKVLNFLGLEEEKWWKQFRSQEEMFQYAAGCRMFWVREIAQDEAEGDVVAVQEGDIEGQEGGERGKKKLKHNDRQRMSKRPIFKDWIDDFIPKLREAGTHDEAKVTREQIRDEAFEKFGIKQEYDERLREWKLVKHKDEIWRDVIKQAVPLEDENYQLRSATIKMLKTIIMEGEIWEGTSPKEALIDEQGFYNVDAVRDFIEKNRRKVGEVAWAIQLERAAEKMREKAEKQSEKKSQKVDSNSDNNPPYPAVAPQFPRFQRPNPMDYVENKMASEASKPPTTAEVTPLLTPLNLILASLFIFILYTQFRPKPAVKLAPSSPATVFKTFTPPTLQPFNGLNNTPVYLAVRGRVFDVSSGRNFYGPGGPYENFAGRDASRGLACGSFDEEMLTKDLQGPLDTLEGLGADEMEALRGWEERFEEKYLVVGRLVAVGEEGN